MIFQTTILFRIYILSILPIEVTSADSSQIGFVALLNSEIPVTDSGSFINPFVDLDADDNRNQTDEHTFRKPEYKPKKRKHNPEISSKDQSSEPPTKRLKPIQDNFLGENTVGYLGEFKHELTSNFLLSKKFFNYEFYDIFLVFNGFVFIKEFCSKDQFISINSNIFLRLDERIKNNFKKLEVYTKRVVAEYVEIFKNENKNIGKLHGNFYASINKALDPERTKGFYYLLIYSFYETGLIGVPGCMAAVEKIFLNIIAHTRLMAYMHNYKVREEIQLKKLRPSRLVLSKMTRNEQSKYSGTNFIYSDFTKALKGAHFKKYDLFHKNADLLRKEINDNIQLIIDKEFGDNSEFKKLCENYNSKALKFNKSILFGRYPFQIGKHVADNHSYEELDYKYIMYVNSYPRNILSYLIDTDTKNQIKELADIKLKSVFILIFISKICLCNVTDLCTLPEYLILIGSLQEAYHEHKPGQDTIANFQSLLSYFFSLHYLERGQVAGKREEARKIIQNVFPEYREIFPNFDSEINNLERA